MLPLHIQRSSALIDAAIDMRHAAAVITRATPHCRLHLITPHAHAPYAKRYIIYERLRHAAIIFSRGCSLLRDYVELRCLPLSMLAFLISMLIFRH